MENKESIAEPRKAYFIKKAHALVGFFNMSFLFNLFPVGNGAGITSIINIENSKLM